MIQAGQISKMINGLANQLFISEFKRIKKQELLIVTENRKLSDNKFDGFFYQGTFYTDLDKSIAHKGIKSGLSSSLVPKMEALVQDRKVVEFDQARVKQALLLILKPCRTAQDIRDALPNQLAEMVDQFKGMRRERPEGFTVMDDPRKLQQYEMLREKIEFYSVTKLFY